MSNKPFASLSFLTGSAFSSTGAEGMNWINPQGTIPGTGLWNRIPPAARSNPIPPNGVNFSNPIPPNGISFSNPIPPNAMPPKAGPLPSMAPPPRLGLDPDWVFSDPASLLGQALGRSAARIARPADRAVTPSQSAAAQSKGRNVKGSALWRWAPEFRAKTVAAEMLGRFQVADCTVYLLAPVAKGGMASPQPVFSLPPDLRSAGVNMSEQIDKVVRAATEREDRLPEILSQLDDFWPFFESVIGLSLDRAPRTTELLAATHDFMLHMLMHLKQNFAASRPVQVSTLVMPLIPTPGHGSLPSGHATMAAFTSELMHQMLYQNSTQAHHQMRSEQLDRLARRIAFNRVVAGLHFPVDSQAGYALGTQMARLTAALAKGGSPPSTMTATQVLLGRFELPEIASAGSGRLAPAKGRPLTVKPAVLLALLWKEACLELAQLRI